MLKSNCFVVFLFFFFSGKLYQYNYTPIITLVNQVQNFLDWALAKH